MKLPVLFILIAFLGGCAKKSPETAAETKKSPNSVEFSEEQLKMSEIKWSNLQKRDVSNIIECNGRIELPPQNNLTISPVLGGNVKSIGILPGMFIKKGEVLAILEHPDYLTLQQDFIEASSRYNYQKEEYKRQGELTLEQATSLKKMQSTEADFKVLEAKVFSLKKQLEMLGIDPEKLKSENITSQIEVRSPIEGYITNIYTNLGKYIGAGEKLCEVIDKSHLHLQLNVFERDLSNLKLGQQIKFSPAAIPNKTFVANVELIGQAVDEENHSIPVHAHISSLGKELKPGMFVIAKIQSNPRKVYALPITSLVRKENGYFAFVYKDRKFERTMVNVGIELDNFVEVIPSDSDFVNNQFVTQGAYYLESEWEKRDE